MEMLRRRVIEKVIHAHDDSMQLHIDNGWKDTPESVLLMEAYDNEMIAYAITQDEQDEVARTMDIKIKKGDWYVDSDGYVHDIVGIMLNDFATRQNGAGMAMYRRGDKTEFKFDMENGVIVWGNVDN